MTGLPTLAEQFLSYLALQKRYSQHTTASYRLDLQQFFEYMQAVYGPTPLGEIDAFQVQSWLATGLRGRGEKEDVSAVTIRRKISTLKSFFKFAVREGAIAQSPMFKVVSPKMRKRLPLFVEEKGMQQMERNEAGGQPLFADDFDGATRQLVLDILYQTGIRRAELIGLRHSGISLPNSHIKVLGKGGKERIIPISNHLVASIRAYTERKGKELENPDQEYLLVKKDGRRVNEGYVYRTVKAALGQVTTLSKKSPHVLRHTFATHLVNNGADINAVKELLGHASLASTQVYTHNTIEKLKNVYKQAHPKA
ncbi:tyrosine-type recombinase/integrase [Chitinophaga alhagiae]|uniref:tyrosine-type recombinase/integrase n=1 Tax=Chitinophaga alhagiae TaxID=2203219 RepID=UPI000E5AA4FD|nr:tyrosine-type recombinase/integrase [Chitinophaga alhagiae]